MTPDRHYCTFLLDGALYGIEVRRVREVVRIDEVRPLPLAAPAVRGLVNLRGDILAAIDLRRCLGLAERPPAETPTHVITTTAGGLVSFLVDEIGDIVDVDPDACAPPPGTLDPVGRELIRGVYQLADRLLLVLDADRAAAPSDEAQPLPRGTSA